MYKVVFPPHITLGLLLLYRARLISVVFFILIGLAFIVILAAQFSGRHPATVSLDVGYSIIKIVIPILFSIISQELIAKESENKSFLLSLSYPYSRVNFLLNRWLVGFTFLLVFYLVSACMLLVLVGFISNGYNQSSPVSLGEKYWIVFLFGVLDILTISSIASLLGVVAKSPGFVLIGTIGFTVIARSYGSILHLLSGDMLVVSDPESYQDSLRFLAYLFPDLGALDIRQVALYNDWGLLPSGLIHASLASVLFSVAILCLATFLFKNKPAA